MTKRYDKPRISTEKSFERTALACAKTTDPPPGSWHFNGGGVYDTFTGHFGPGFGGMESDSGSVFGGGPGGTSGSYPYSAMCANWITFAS